MIDSFQTDRQDALTGDIDVTKLPLHPSPPGLANGQLLVDLLPHQSQGLQVSTSISRVPKVS
jgi:SWI/SNF-related matrix-associated actin-dependent regulator of chromatin subfamily A3